MLYCKGNELSGTPAAHYYEHSGIAQLQAAYAEF